MNGTYLPNGISEARKRMEAAGRAFAERNQQTALRASAAARKAKAQRQVAAIKSVREAVAADAAATAETFLYSSPAARIVMRVADAHDVPVSDIMGSMLARDITAARIECYWRIRNELKWSYPRIGAFFSRTSVAILRSSKRYERLRKAGRA